MKTCKSIFAMLGALALIVLLGLGLARLAVEWSDYRYLQRQVERLEEQTEQLRRDYRTLTWEGPLRP